MAICIDEKLVSDVIVEKFEIYSRKNLKKYTDLFDEFKNNGSIIDCQFEDENWILYDEVKRRGLRLNFNEVKFNEEKKKRKLEIDFKDFVYAVKYLTLIKYKYYSIEFVRTFPNKLKNIVLHTSFFNSEKIQELEKIFKKNIAQASGLDSILDFIDFFPQLKISDRYISMLIYYNESYLEYREKNRTNRILPNFESVFKFSDNIDNLLNKCSLEEKETFFPIFIWWKITTTIPLRTTELIIIPKNCLEYNDGEYYINLRRSALKGQKQKEVDHSLDSYYIQKIKINKETYDLINEYLELVDKYDYMKDFYGENIGEMKERKFLFSYRSYYKFRINRNESINTNLDVFSTLNFRILLKRFFKDILSKRYTIIPKDSIKKSSLKENYIEWIQPMDTRHFATINMILQEFNPLILKELSGHKDIKSSYNYYNHLPNFVRCWVYNLAERKSVEKTKKQNIEGLKYNISTLTNVELKYRHIFGKTEGIELTSCNNDRGKCSSKKDFKKCLIVDRNCEICDYYYPNQDTMNDIYKNLEYIENKIDVEIELLKKLVRKHKKLTNFDEKYKIHINKIFSYANQGADIIYNYALADEEIDSI